MSEDELQKLNNKWIRDGYSHFSRTIMYLLITQGTWFFVSAFLCFAILIIMFVADIIATFKE